MKTPQAGTLGGMPQFTPRCLESIRADVQAFADAREWERFHSTRNLLLAVVSEIGEAAELVRWSGDAQPAVPPERQQDWADELADVFILLVRLADRSGVDLSAAFARKLTLAGEKYPADRFRGSSRKYDQADPPQPPITGADAAISPAKSPAAPPAPRPGP